MLKLALYQPEIPQNTGTLMRLGACLDVGIEIIEPCSFIFDDKRLKRAGMDYRDKTNLTMHNNVEQFFEKSIDRRVILLDVKGAHDFYDFEFLPTDIFMLGRESDGVPDDVRMRCSDSVHISMQDGFRSLNVAIAAAMVLSEAIRQTRKF